MHRINFLFVVLEVYQFARDAAVAEAWLIAQEPYLMSTELGHTIDEVENLIKKHEAFEKSAAAQEERFSALERLTTVCTKPKFIKKNKNLSFLHVSNVVLIIFILCFHVFIFFNYMVLECFFYPIPYPFILYCFKISLN